MALTQLYTAVADDVITSARWNNEFGNIYNNGTDVGFPATKAVSFAGFTLTLDAAGVTTITSPATAGYVFTPGSKSGTPSANGGLVTYGSMTYTDSGTAAAGTAALHTSASFRTPTLAATNITVTTTIAATVYIEGAPIAGTNETITNPYALYVDGGKVQFDGALQVGGASTFDSDMLISVSDARTATVDLPLTLTSVTSGAPAANIGTGVLFRAESADENPSDVGQAEFAFSDIGAGSEDSYFQVLLRVAGAALTACWRFVATGAFKGIFTHANTADRTYNLPNRNLTFGGADVVSGPSSTGASSTRAHEGTVTISSNQALDGIHFYTDFTLDAGVTVTPNNNSDRLIIIATGTITINGTIAGTGAGSSGGAGVASVDSTGGAGSVGFAQPGGGGGASQSGAGDGGAGGSMQTHSVVKTAGGVGGTTAAQAGTAGSIASGANLSIADPFSYMGGAGGGAGGGGAAAGVAGGAGGRGGCSIVLVAPTVVLGAAAVLTTNGGAGTAGADDSTSDSGSGGGGGAGNIFIQCTSYTNNGATFNMTGGAAGSGFGGAGGAGANGVLQINIYS